MKDAGRRRYQHYPILSTYSGVEQFLFLDLDYVSEGPVMADFNEYLVSCVIMSSRQNIFGLNLQSLSTTFLSMAHNLYSSRGWG